MCFVYTYTVTFQCGHKFKTQPDRRVACEGYWRAGIGYNQYHAVEVPQESFGGTPFCDACQMERKRIKKLVDEENEKERQRQAGIHDSDDA